MEISEAIDREVKAQWRHDLINILKDAGRTLAGTGLRANGSVYRDINIGLLLLEAARSLQECQSELEPENPDDVVLKVTVCGWDDIFEVAGIAAVKRISETMHYCPNCGARMWA